MKYFINTIMRTTILIIIKIAEAYNEMKITIIIAISI